MTERRDFSALVAGERRGAMGRAWLPITDPAEFGDSGSPFKEQSADGLWFCALVKTAAVRYPA